MLLVARIPRRADLEIGVPSLAGDGFVDFFEIHSEAIGGLAVAEVEVAVEIGVFLDDELTGEFAGAAFFVDEAIAIGIDADGAFTLPRFLALILVLGHEGPALPAFEAESERDAEGDEDGPALPWFQAAPPRDDGALPMRPT